MLDLLRRACCRWKLRPHHVTADGTYGTIENIAGVKRSGFRTYLGLHEGGGRMGFFPKSAFANVAEEDLYCARPGRR